MICWLLQMLVHLKHIMYSCIRHMVLHLATPTHPSPMIPLMVSLLLRSYIIQGWHIIVSWLLWMSVHLKHIMYCCIRQMVLHLATPTRPSPYPLMACLLLIYIVQRWYIIVSWLLWVLVHLKYIMYRCIRHMVLNLATSYQSVVWMHVRNTTFFCNK